MARADMESANPVPIVQSGCWCQRRQAGGVIGIEGLWCDRYCHDGRVVSTQRVVGQRESVGQFESLPVDFVGNSAGRLAEGGLIAKHAVANASKLVGQGAGGFVVIGTLLQIDGPASNTGELLAFAQGARGGAKYRSRAASEQHTRTYP